MQGVGGTVELAPGYLKSVYETVRKAGGVCIADEVQSGFGRTGSNYWGFQTQDVIPDIVTMAKVRGYWEKLCPEGLIYVDSIVQYQCFPFVSRELATVYHWVQL